MLIASSAFAQVGLKINVQNGDGQFVKNAEVFVEPDKAFATANKNGKANFYLDPGTKTISIYSLGYAAVVFEVQLVGDSSLTKVLTPLNQVLSEVVIEQEGARQFGMHRMNSVEGVTVYAGKKNEVILPDQIDANKSANNARQVYGRIPGVNVWESDGAGIQLGIGVRGLSPNRTANINVRQNGYDISADALGYPESYYTPPLEAVERIEFVRGAASLQYGTQFGGMMNFRMKEGAENKPFEFTTRQTVGTYGFFNSFNSIGGSHGKLNYYGFYQFKRGNGWRANSDFDVHTAYAKIGYNFNERWALSGEYTHMDYLAQQAGGLTDQQFTEDPRQATRDRNWFKVNWNLAALKLRGQLSARTTVDLRIFGLIAQRQSLGFLGIPTRVDDLTAPRNLISGQFQNMGAEARLLHRYTTGTKRNIIVVGGRAYHGDSNARQGNANSGFGADFDFINPSALEGSDYDFENVNYAAFAENVLYLSDRFTVTPGLRYELIDTRAAGYYTSIVTDQVGNVLERTETKEGRERYRHFLLAGIGLSFKALERTEFYGNASQNYRAINFSDIRIQNPSLRIDPDIKDESGYNIDLGVRGDSKRLRYDLSAFYLAYKDRIGALQKRDSETFQFYRLRDNIADSYAYGVEAYAEVVTIMPEKEGDIAASVFANATYTEAQYIAPENSAIDGNRVELTPTYIVRGGVRFAAKGFSSSLQISHVGEQYTDATNALSDPGSINGLIPAYTVADLSTAYSWKQFKVEFGVNNLTNAAYFTRRAVGYPGPGILPSDGISTYLTLEARF